MPDSTASYTLERSPDGVNWQLLKVFDSTGTFYDDASPLNPTNYYRLTETSVNGLTIPHDIAVVTVIPPMGNPPGTIAWANSTHGGISGDFATVNNVTVDAQGNSIICGSFRGSIDLGNGVFVNSTGGSTASDMFVVKYDSSGQYTWSKNIGSIFNDTANGVATDSQGNVIVVGSFGGTVDFGGISKTAVSGTDIFVAKYPASGGNAIWVNSYGTSGVTQNDVANSVACDSFDNVIVGGILANSDIDMGGGNMPAIGGQDVFILKLSAIGTFVWAKRWGGPGGDQLRAIAVDADNNVAIVGTTFGSSVDLGGGSIPTHGQTDFFIAKYSGVDGSYIWAKLIGSDRNDSGLGIACDKTAGTTRNRIVVVGGYLGQTGTDALDFGGIVKTTNGGGTAVFVAVYDPTGLVVWVNSYGGEFGTSDFGTAVTVDAAGNIIATGSIQSAVDFGGGFRFGDGSQNYFAVGLSANGDWRWDTRVVGTGGGVGGVSTDLSRNAITTGAFGGNVNLGTAGNPVTVSTPSGSKSCFVAKYSN